MSILSRERLIVAISPASVEWVRVRGTFGRRAVACGSIDADPGFGREPWAGAIAALRTQALHWARERVAVTVVLSNHFVRYALLERPARGVSREEEIALARFHFTRLHGERAAAWDVRVAPADRGSRHVASAIDRELLSALQSAFPSDARPRLKSVQPYLMCAFNRWRGKLDRRGGWLVLVEPGRVCFAMLAGRAWNALQSVRSAHDDERSDWLALLEREKQRATVQPAPKSVLARSGVSAKRDAESRREWQVVMLEPPALAGVPEAELERYAMALHAA